MSDTAMHAHPPNAIDQRSPNAGSQVFPGAGTFFVN